ncbi:ABC transporter ATP-binding protein [Sanguibacter suaedae]|uniref:ABC transporter ATP-binding protein n=1 Tax=Sanguibacter suaedae TaxID=2795737 RepID=A0A934M8N5_9MICO|nr:ABC transporter ATP-binding protein [Sanguibacter suaedae]MBI9113773.1 ABC transporter ATP-binding protein [Sanguibacter suaedae]
MTTPPAVRVRGLTKTYGTVRAVQGIDLDVEQGETLALLGPNGAGKSTTVEILEGYRDRTAGDVSVLGVDPGRGGVAWKARLGIVLQTSSETPAVTVREQVAHFAALYPRPRDVDEVVQAVGLTAQAGMLVRNLSGGQRRRVDVALGIVGNPELVFLDEPTTGFDPEARRSFWDLVRGLKDDGTTIVLTTHYLDEAAQLGDRAAVIAQGRLLEVDRVDRIGGPDARTPIVRWTHDGRPRSERTREPGLLVARLVAETGREPDDLEIVRPSLEDVYLDMVATATAAAADDAAVADDHQPARTETAA